MNSSSSSAWVVIVVVLLLYFLPTIIAELRHVENTGPTIIVNFFLGWTFLGWVVALAMAAGARTREAVMAVAPAEGGLATYGRPDVGSDPKGWLQPGVEVTKGEKRGVFTRVTWRGEGGVEREAWARSEEIEPYRQSQAAQKTCPQCAEKVQAAAKICRFCRHHFDMATE